jgi:hypothetical protein
MNKTLFHFTLNRENQRQQDKSLKFCLSFSDFLSYPIDPLGQSIGLLKALLGNENPNQCQVFYFAVELKITIDGQIIRLSPSFGGTDIAACYIEFDLMSSCVLAAQVAMTKCRDGDRCLSRKVRASWMGWASMR